MDILDDEDGAKRPQRRFMNAVKEMMMGKGEMEADESLWRPLKRPAGGCSSALASSANEVSG